MTLDSRWKQSLLLCYVFSPLIFLVVVVFVRLHLGPSDAELREPHVVNPILQAATLVLLCSPAMVIAAAGLVIGTPRALRFTCDVFWIAFFLVGAAACGLSVALLWNVTRNEISVVHGLWILGIGILVVAARLNVATARLFHHWADESIARGTPNH